MSRILTVDPIWNIELLLLDFVCSCNTVERHLSVVMRSRPRLHRSYNTANRLKYSFYHNFVQFLKCCVTSVTSITSVSVVSF